MISYKEVADQIAKYKIVSNKNLIQDTLQVLEPRVGTLLNTEESPSVYKGVNLDKGLSLEINFVNGKHFICLKFRNTDHQSSVYKQFKSLTDLPQSLKQTVEEAFSMLSDKEKDTAPLNELLECLK